MLLAIDTSTRTASVALFDGQNVEAELTWQSEMNHTSELFPAIYYLLGQAKTELNAVSRLAVALGPGSFNGLRVGVSTAKALSYALGVPVAGVSTLEAQAHAHAWSGRPICAVLRAGREEVAAAMFQRRDGELARLLDEQITTIGALSEKITTATVFTGEIDDRLASEISAAMGSNAAILPGESRLRRAGFLAALGWQFLEAGQAADVATVQPLYLRRPPITMRQKP